MRTAELADLTGMSPAAVREWGSRLPLESVAVERVPRAWTLRDSVSILVASAIVDRGFSVPASLAFTSAMAAEFVHLTVDETAEAWLIASRSDFAASGWRCHVATDRPTAMDATFSVEGAVVFRVRPLLTEAMLLLLAASRADAKVPA